MILRLDMGSVWIWDRDRENWVGRGWCRWEFRWRGCYGTVTRKDEYGQRFNLALYMCVQVTHPFLLVLQYSDLPIPLRSYELSIDVTT